MYINVCICTFTYVQYRFVIGYCLDYNEMGRDLPHLAVINDCGVATFKEEFRGFHVEPK
jgi:hypoxanthine-guanine phosphoribosyltransferase